MLDTPALGPTAVPLIHCQDIDVVFPRSSPKSVVLPHTLNRLQVRESYLALSVETECGESYMRDMGTLSSGRRTSKPF